MNNDNTESLVVSAETPRGIVTTEFWLVLASNIITAVLAALGEIDATWAAVAVTILTGLYTLLRSAIKTKALG